MCSLILSGRDEGEKRAQALTLDVLIKESLDKEWAGSPGAGRKRAWANGFVDGRTWD
jgi:hypothetical protein